MVSIVENRVGRKGLRFEDVRVGDLLRMAEGGSLYYKVCNDVVMSCEDYKHLRYYYVETHTIGKYLFELVSLDDEEDEG